MPAEITNNYEKTVNNYEPDIKKTDSGKKDEKPYKTTDGYIRYLQDKYPYMNTGTKQMYGVPVTISVSGRFLKECANDPEKAKYLEENLKVMPQGAQSLVNSARLLPGSPVCTYVSYIVDDNGNISCMTGVKNDPDGKIARENAQKKLKEKRTEEDKEAKKRAEKKAKEKRTRQRQAEKKAVIKTEKETEEYTINAKGTDVKTITQNLVNAFSGIDTAPSPVFDIQA